MRSSMLLAVLLAPISAYAVCNTASPLSPENDCDFDGVTIGQGDCDDMDAARYPGKAEICDNKDNDCNQVVDNGNPGGNMSCSTGLMGVCAAGTTACTSGAIVCNQLTQSSPETCNNQDDNCNGVVDEAVTRVCFAGPAGTFSGTCPGPNCVPRLECKGVTQSCAAGAFPACTTATAGQTLPTAEVCDGKDNDCDGQTDEGNPGGGANCTTGQMGVCSPGTATCSGGSVGCVRNVNPTAETCNNLDDDCNGQTDENVTRVCFAGPAGTFSGTCPGPNCVPRLECKGVSQACSAGNFPACTTTTPGQTLPATEICDGKDNDCDGQTDEGNLGGGASCSTGQAGVCSPGTATCTGGAVSCVRNVNPSAETCNNQDDDCNGQTDENVTRVCFAGPAGTFSGTCPGPSCVPRLECKGVSQSCTAGNFPTCDLGTAGQTLPAAETCDGKDNDCDGQTDEGNPGGGGACSTGQMGVCGPGTFQCTAGALACQRTVNPGGEICNNQDDDCDGQVDELVTRVCYAGPAGSYTGTCPGASCAPRLECKGVMQACAAGNFPTCDLNTPGQQFPSAEICDNKDNDCDGAIDDGNPGGGSACTTTQAGRCAAGTMTCAAGALGCARNQGPISEVCNGIDDNCNSFIDERSTNNALKLQQNCYPFDAGQPGQGTCAAGNQDCTAASGSGVAMWSQCLNAVGPSTEICNGLSTDENCNGVIDEGFDVDNDGFRSCLQCGGLTPCDCNDNDPTIKPGAVEICDNIDQDCDGNPINVPARKCFSGPTVTTQTYTGTCPGPSCLPKGVCLAGTQACIAGGTYGACVGQVVPTSHPDGGEQVGVDGGAACNLLDDDCDGIIDDGDFDQDRDGVKVCQGDCNDDPDGGQFVKPGALEMCNGIDDNCDGVIDGVSTACYSGPALPDGGSSVNTGVCRAGTAQCVGGVPQGTCMGQTTPGTEVCNKLDDDCDGKIDEDFDFDGDGVPSCALCPGITPCDCNDNPDGGQFVRPGLPEICDCLDNNCNAQVDEGQVCRGAPCHDFDNDGITNCQGDCDDNDALISPRRTERVGNGRDDDCDGQVDEVSDEDLDSFTTAMGDCDDKSADINPGAVEKCDGFDNDCDGVVDEGFDKDGDFATTCAGDCDDNDPTRSPYRKEVCGNAKDDNCDGRIDEDTDQDQDGVTTCQGDCNDLNSAVHGAFASVAAAAEVCDGQDNDCDLQTDEGFDADNDHVATCLGDCNDNNPAVNSAAIEIAGNGIDDNCNGMIDEGALDKDNDGYSGFCGDCNDSDSSIHPHGTEVCDRIDNDCDGYVDSAPGQFNLCAACFDADGDGQTNCDGDCNDADKTVYRGAAEVCDLKDNDCEGSVDLDLSGLRICTDAGVSMPDAGVDGGGTTLPEDGGTGGDGGTGPGTVKPVVAASCGCGSTDGGALGLLVLLLAFSRRRKVALAVVAAALVGCQSRLTAPAAPDAGTGGSGGGAADAGPKDAGFIPPVLNWACDTLFPHEIIPRNIGGTGFPFAIVPEITSTEVAVAQAWVFDDAPNDVAAFVLRRAVPMDVVPTDGGFADPADVALVAVREIAALNGLGGTPVVRDRTERFSRTYPGSVYTSSQTLNLAIATNAFSLRNRLLSSLSGKTQTELGALTVAAGARAEDTAIVNLMFKIVKNHLFIAVAVTPGSKFKDNQPVMTDLTNGSHLGLENDVLFYRCEKRTAPALRSDFIFVVDNSGSMIEEQATLVAASESMYAAFAASGLDFRLGVVNTEGEVLRGKGFTRDLDQFKADVRVGINGNGDEQGLEFGLRAIRRARNPMVMEPPSLCPAADPACLHLRPGAGLVVVFVSDEESVNLKSVKDYALDYQAEKALAFAIVGPRPIGCTRVGLGSANAGTSYIDVATATGGSSGSICNPNLLEVVEEVVIGALGTASQSSLAQRPISGSLAVKIAQPVNRSRTMGFDYDPAGNTVLFFGVVPPEGAPFDVVYSYFAPFE